MASHPKKQKSGTRPRGPASYRQRTYRHSVDPTGLVSCMVRVGQTDLHILASREVTDRAALLVHQYRSRLENYIAGHPEFLSALEPLAEDPLAPPLVKAMMRAAAVAGVGPMAAVAGAIAEFVGRDLLEEGIDEVVIENGGDIYIKRQRDCIAAIFAGASPLSGRVGVAIAAASMPLGLCTSSGTVGHSLSYGNADAVTVLASSTPLADAAATRLGNEVLAGQPINRALDLAKTIPGLLGVVVVRGAELGGWGGVELVSIVTSHRGK